MLITNLYSRLNISAKTITDDDSATGNAGVDISADLTALNLDSFFAKQYSNAELVYLTHTLNDFPDVDLDSVPALDAAGSALLLNSTHAICIRLAKENPALPVTGYVTVTLTKLGGSSPATRQMKAGDILTETCELGWPANASTAISIVGGGTLTNTKLLIALAGHTTATGTGYA